MSNNSTHHELNSVALKCINNFKKNSDDLIRLVETSMTKNQNNSWVKSLFAFPFSVFQNLFTFFKVAKGTAMIQTLLGGLAVALGITSGFASNLLIIGIVVVAWYLSSLGIGLFMMGRAVKDNPYFHHAYYRLMQPANYKNVELMASEKTFFDYIEKLMVNPDFLHEQHSDLVESIQETHNELVQSLNTKFEIEREDYQKLIIKLSKMINDLINGEKFLPSDFNLFGIPMIVFKEESSYMKKIYDDSTDVLIKKSYVVEDFDNAYPYIQPDGAKNNFFYNHIDDNSEFYTLKLTTSKDITWIVTFIWNPKKEITAMEFYLDDILPVEFILETYRKIAENID